MAEVKVRKHDIQEAKRPDALLQGATSLFDWILDHRTGVVGGLVAVFAVSGGIAIAQSVHESHYREVGAKLGDAIALDTRPVGTEKKDDDTFATQTDKDNAVRSALDSVAKGNPGTVAAQSASLMLASSRFSEAKYDDAISLAKGYVADPAGGTLQPFAYETLGNAYAAKGDTANAEDAYKKLGDAGQPAQALYLRATLLERSGKTDEAKKLYEQVVADYEKDDAAKDARTHLDMIQMPPSGLGNLAAPAAPSEDENKPKEAVKKPAKKPSHSSKPGGK